jgi:hypothetical protein
MRPLTLLVLPVLIGFFAASSVLARPAIKSDFFDRYPTAVGSVLDDVPSNSNHCGVCHFDFNGGGSRTPYGEALKTYHDVNSVSWAQAVVGIENDDPDGDNFTTVQEINALGDCGNTPTFPGLSTSNVNLSTNVTIGDVSGNLTPANCTVTGVPDNPSLQASTVRANPNPFNPVTTITYTVPSAGPISISVYDVNGRLVDVLVDNEYREPNEYRVQYRPSGPTGIYFLRLEAREKARTLKIVLLK